MDRRLILNLTLDAGCQMFDAVIASGCLPRRGKISVGAEWLSSEQNVQECDATNDDPC